MILASATLLIPLCHHELDALALAMDQGDMAAAQRFYEQSLALCRAMDDSQGIAAALNGLGNALSEQGDVAVARRVYEESLGIKRAIGDKQGIALTLSNLGAIALEQRDYAMAQERFDESLTLCRMMDTKLGVTVVLSNLGILALEQGDPEAAHAHYRESLVLARYIGYKLGVVWNLVGLAGVAMQVEVCASVAPRDAAYAAKLIAAAEALLMTMNGVLELLERRIRDRTVAAARAALGDEAFAAAWAAGEALTLDEAVELALSLS